MAWTTRPKPSPGFWRGDQPTGERYVLAKMDGSLIQDLTDTSIDQMAKEDTGWTTPEQPDAGEWEDA